MQAQVGGGKMLGISNLDIEEILFSEKAQSFMNNCTAIGFSGVFSSNNLPSKLIKKNCFSLICNLSRDTEPGTHFITIIFYSTYIFYIDSLGLPCLNKDVRNYLDHFNLPIMCNSQQIQDSQSVFCGFFCILFILFYEARRDDKKKLVALEWNTKLDCLKLNDEKCIQNICDLLK